ncbi:MAG: sigma factor-like helix-turn-helix DNA-binding protein [Acidobacteriota bacterium]|nr:sigma factor-like helix-turn-helix DNA-binding protein [Acidobacteriota bacterium]
MSRIQVTVGPANANFMGSDHLTIQAAVDYVVALGGGAVRIRPGVYEMGNSLFLRPGVRIIGSGDETVLRKRDGTTTPLVESVDWYEESVRVQDPSIFQVGSGIWFEGMSPFYQGRNQIAKRTVIGIDGDRIFLDKAPREDFWLESGANASTSFPVITAEYVNDAAVESLMIDGNRANNPHLDDNHAGAVFIQDCDRIEFRNLTIRELNREVISAQICDDLIVDNCRISNCADLLEEHAGLLPIDGRVRQARPEGADPLSPRQRQVWDLREKGLTYKQISEKLGTTMGSVSATLHEARRRLGVTREQVLEENRRR